MAGAYAPGILGVGFHVHSREFTYRKYINRWLVLDRSDNNGWSEIIAECKTKKMAKAVIKFLKK